MLVLVDFLHSFLLSVHFLSHRKEAKNNVIMSGVNCERPINRYHPPDWHARNYKLADEARSTREQSLNLRKEAQLLKIETDTRTKWHNFDNNMRLSERYHFCPDTLFAYEIVV